MLLQWNVRRKRTLFIHKHHCPVCNSGVEKGNVIARMRLWNIIVFYIVTCVYCSRNKANTVQICMGFLCLVSCVQQRSFCQKRWDLSLVVLGTGTWVTTWGFWFGWYHWLVVSLFCFCLAVNQKVVWFSQYSRWQTECFRYGDEQRLFRWLAVEVESDSWFCLCATTVPRSREPVARAVSSPSWRRGKWMRLPSDKT